MRSLVPFLLDIQDTANSKQQTAMSVSRPPLSFHTLSSPRMCLGHILRVSSRDSLFLRSEVRLSEAYTRGETKGKV